MHRIYKTTTLLVLIAALLFTSFPVSALSSGESGGQSVKGTATSTTKTNIETVDASLDVSAEIVLKRSEFEKHYLLADGSFLAVVYPEAVHYQDEASYETAYGIMRGMTYREVTSLIGLPQRRLTSGLVVVEYALADGASAHIEYVMNSEGLYVVESVEVFEQGVIK